MASVRAVTVTASTVTVEVLRYHTFAGIARDEGTTYEIDPTLGEGGHPFLGTLEALGMVRRTTDDKPTRRGK